MPLPPPNHCPVCGAVVPDDSPDGSCPRCLLQAAMQPTGPEDAPRPQPPSLATVSAAFPQLEILELIGHGGMGAVFKARQPKLDRLVALKLLPASLAERDAAFAGRFEREGRLLARLHHPNIVAVHDSGTAGGFFYLLMEFVEGVNLRQAMRSRRFTPAQALAIVPHICDALQFAHEEGVLHRDIKPENILLDAKGRVKLADFGIAKLVGDGTGGTHTTHDSHESHPGLTHSGSTLGTPSYMAPEQRDTPGAVDHRADIYSLGVVFYELLTGELPVGKFAPPSTLSAADPRVDAIVQQALEKERERRQSSAGEVKTQVEAMAPGTGQKVPPPETLSNPAHPPVPATSQLSQMKTHTQIVALLHIGLGVFALLGAIAVFAFLGLAGGIVVSQGEKEAAGIIGIVAVCVGGFLAVVALPGILGGWGLYVGRGWARPLVLVLGFLHLSNIPFGTAIGIYTIWALLNEPQTQTLPPAPAAVT